MANRLTILLLCCLIPGIVLSQPGIAVSPVVKATMLGPGHQQSLWFQCRQGASAGAGDSLDVANPRKDAMLDFALEDHPLQLWLNTLPAELFSFEIPFYSRFSQPGTYSFSFSDLEDLYRQYNCILLYDALLDQYIDPRKEYRFSVPASFSGVRFTLKLAQDALINRISIVHDSCLNAPARLTIDLTGWAGPVALELVRVGRLGKHLEGSGMIDETIEAGKYVLINHKGPITCGSDIYEFEIPEQEQVRAAFEAPAAVAVNEPVMFVNTSEGAGNFAWKFEEGLPLTNERDPIYTFTKSGTYDVTLFASNDNNCPAQSYTRTVTVSSPNGLDEQPGPGFKIVRTELGVEIHNPERELVSCRIYSPDGRLVREIKTLEETERISLMGRVCILVFTTSTGVLHSTRIQ